MVDKYYLTHVFVLRTHFLLIIE